MRKIFSFAQNDLVPVAAPTDFIVIQGSDSQNASILRITISTEGATGPATMSAILTRRSTANAGAATLNNIVASKLDPSSDAASCNVIYVSGANFTTLGVANGGLLGAKVLTFNAVGNQSSVEWEYRWTVEDGMYLKGSNDFICFGFNGDALPVGTPKFYVEVLIEETGKY